MINYKHIVLPLILFIAVGCVSTSDILDDQTASKIPEGSDTIVLSLTEHPDSTFTDVRRKLIRDGHRIEYDEELKTITTDGIDIGESTFARYTLYIEDGQMVGRANWMIGSAAHAMASALSGVNMASNWEPARWDDGGRPKRAFASLVVFMSDIPHDRLEYR